MNISLKLKKLERIKITYTFVLGLNRQLFSACACVCVCVNTFISLLFFVSKKNYLHFLVHVFIDFFCSACAKPTDLLQSCHPVHPRTKAEHTPGIYCLNILLFFFLCLNFILFLSCFPLCLKKMKHGQKESCV